MDSQTKNKFRVYISMGGVTLLVCSLGFVIYLGVNQYNTLLRLSAAADRMQESIDTLFKERAVRKAEEVELIKLEDQTTEDMKELN